jgi:predicted metal-dependent HD superfamily phosphohydrolase
MQQEDNNQSVFESTSKFVTQLFKERQPDWAVYHNLSHTVETVNGCFEIGNGSDLAEEDLEIICIAAWFHDTGYIFKVEGHEEESSVIALNFLKESKYPTDKINAVINCILATKTSIAPQNLLEYVICDSDLISLGRPDYFEKNDLLKLETEMRKNIKISELAWLERSLKFLSSHNFFTEYAKLNFNPQLESNLITLKKKIDEY